MAFASMIRKASSSLALPFAVRALGAPRILQRAAVSTTILGPGKERPTPDLTRPIGLPQVRKLSAAVAEETSADENLIQILESEIDEAIAPEVACIPDGFPFEIQDRPGSLKVVLHRKSGDEVVKVVVDLLSMEDIGEDNSPCSIPLLATITKLNGQQLEFCITAFPREFEIESVAVRDSESDQASDEELPSYFSDMDSEVQKAFHRYLEARGIKASTMRFLFNYVVNKDKRELVRWLNKVKDFVAN